MKLILKILAAILGIFLATKFVPGVSLKIVPGKSIYFGIELTQGWQILILVGTVLGLINLFIKPILNLISLPLKILTLGFFSLILNMGIIWFLDVFFAELQILGLKALFFTTLIIWIMNLILDIKE